MDHGINKTSSLLSNGKTNEVVFHLELESMSAYRGCAYLEHYTLS